MTMRGFTALLLLGVAWALPAAAQDKNAPGVTASEIKIGNTMPYSGAASAYGAIGRAEAGYFQMINEQGGVNGRKIDFVTLDDGYSPPKTVEQTRRLVESDKVAFIYSSLGTVTSVTVRKYLNERKVPQIFITSGASFWNDPSHYPWTIGFQPNYRSEGRIYGRYVAEHLPKAKIAVLYQNDDAGRDYATGFKEGLGPEMVKHIVAETTYEVTDPTLDSQIVSLQSSGADVLFNNSTPKFAAQAIRKIHDVGWKPLHFLSSTSASVSAVMQPAGIEKSQGVISAAYYKDPTDKQWADDPAMKTYTAWLKKYDPDADVADIFNVYGYSSAQALIQVLKQCGSDLSRENIMKEVAHLDMTLPMLLPGIKVSTSPTDFAPLKQMRLERFEGSNWMLFGDVIGG
jgi:branched-chain amino acid transport system substrate-binding protein